MRNKFRNVLVCLFCLLAQSHKSLCQVAITGPTRVIADTEYQYLISGNWDDYSTMQLCIQGGIIVNTDSTCFNGSPVASIHVIWKEDSTASISINSSDGDAFLSMERTTILDGGKIDTLGTIQIVEADSIPKLIHCPEATGGNCSPSYAYQWQQSLDNLSWTDIDGSTSEDLILLAPLAQTTYYRRKVTETISNTIKYSDVAIVVIDISTENNP